MTPRATYRLQLTPTFGFDRAAEVVPYLAALGVSHVYCSPYLRAAAGSEHGLRQAELAQQITQCGGADTGGERKLQPAGQRPVGRHAETVTARSGFPLAGTDGAPATLFGVRFPGSGCPHHIPRSDLSRHVHHERIGHPVEHPEHEREAIALVGQCDHCIRRALWLGRIHCGAAMAV